MFTDSEYRGLPAEMFALGVLLFVMVMGWYPFDEATEKDQLFVLLQKDDTSDYWETHRDKYDYRENLATPSFRDLIKALLTKDVTQRLNLSQFMQHPWMAKNYASQAQARKEIIQRRAP